MSNNSTQPHQGSGVQRPNTRPCACFVWVETWTVFSPSKTFLLLFCRLEEQALLFSDLSRLCYGPCPPEVRGSEHGSIHPTDLITKSPARPTDHFRLPIMIDRVKNVFLEPAASKPNKARIWQIHLSYVGAFSPNQLIQPPID